MLPIPGTGSVAHLEENCAAAEVDPHRRRVRGPAEGCLVVLRAMPQLRVGLAQIDTTVGDLHGNADLVSTLRRARPRGRLPRGRLPGDDADRLHAGGPRAAQVVRQARARRPCRCSPRASQDEGAGEIAVGRRLLRPQRTGRPRRSADRPASRRTPRRVLWRGRGRRDVRQAPPAQLRRLRRVPLLRARRPLPCGAAARRRRGGSLICEDLWQEGGPVTVAREAGVGLILCPNASPYERFKDDVRGDLVARRAQRGGRGHRLRQPWSAGRTSSCTTATPWSSPPTAPSSPAPRCGSRASWRSTSSCRRGSVDLAATSTPSDGTTMHVDRIVLTEQPVAGVPAAGAPAWRSGSATRPELWGALVTATRDYVQKNGFRSVVLGLSGGIDSAVVATIACDALGPERVHVIGMPSDWSSEQLGRRRAGAGAAAGPALAADPDRADGRRLPRGDPPRRPGPGEPAGPGTRHPADGAVEPARPPGADRPATRASWRPASPPCTATRAGGFAPIKDVPKTLVWALARWRNTQGLVIPMASIEKPPSAELAPGQLDSDRLPPYDVLDALLDAYVEQDLGRAELIAEGLRRRDGRPDRAAGGPRGVQAPAVPAGSEGDVPRVRPRPAPADHQPLARGPLTSPTPPMIKAQGPPFAARRWAFRLDHRQGQGASGSGARPRPDRTGHPGRWSARSSP